MFNAYNDLNQMAADGARFAAVGNFPGTSALLDNADTPLSKSATVAGPTYQAPGSSTWGGPCVVGGTVKVTATANMELIPFLPYINSTLPGVPTLTGSAEMRVERCPTMRLTPSHRARAARRDGDHGRPAVSRRSWASASSPSTSATGTSTSASSRPRPMPPRWPVPPPSSIRATTRRSARPRRATPARTTTSSDNVPAARSSVVHQPTELLGSGQAGRPRPQRESVQRRRGGREDDREGRAMDLRQALHAVHQCAGTRVDLPADDCRQCSRLWQSPTRLPSRPRRTS